MTAKKLDEAPAPWLSAQSPQGFQHRHISFARAVMLDALPAPNPYLLVVGQAAEESVRYRGLANPGLTCDEYDLPLTLSGFV
jgi:hypothetical protein